MTNEPPTDGTPDPEDGELVDADLPGMREPDADLPEPNFDQLLEDVPPQPFEDPAVREALDTEISPESRARQAEADRALSDAVAEAQPPIEDTRIREAIDTTISPESRARQPAQPDRQIEGDDLVEADLPTTSSGASQSTPPPPTSEAEPDPLEAIDRAVEEWDEALDAEARDRREVELESYRDEYGPDVDAEGMLEYDNQHRPDPPSFPLFDRVLPSSPRGRLLAAILGAAGVALIAFGVSELLTGSDAPDATGLPAATAEATTAPTEAATTATPAGDVVGEAPAVATTPDDLALAAIEAYADEAGDLWLELQLEAPLDGDPNTLDFVHAFTIGAAIQTEAGYNGFYFYVLAGDSYGEAFFGSPDFPRTSSAFSAGFQIEQPDLWITDDGALAVHLPGDNSGNGLDATLFNPTSPLLAGAAVVAEQGDAGSGGFEEYALGPIALAGALPLDGWIEIQPDREPLRLDVPDTSNRN